MSGLMPDRPIATVAVPPERSNPMAWWPFARSPLTDPRSLASSFAIHALALVVASLVAFRVVGIEEPPKPNPSMVGEIDPIDTRAPSQDGGGAAGELGGETSEVAVENGVPLQATRDPAADELLAEIIPRRSGVEPGPQVLPGPSTSGLGLMPGPGTGGGGGAGGGSNLGAGTGTGPGTEFFGVRDRAGSYAYVIDCSGSMSARDSLDVAKRELLASLNRLPPEGRFGVVFYNLTPTVFTDPQGRQALMPAIPASKERVRALLQGIQPYGGTDHMTAIRSAIALKPEVIFFLTDADLMTRQDVTQIRSMLGKTRIQVVEFGVTGSLGDSAPLQSLARETGGSYRYIDVRTFKK
ncbi:vWA domain-containing protein [Tundrisphaera sp. TA3]|uniref:vWA domain-containing protein n=1 Tax=Tundrisphaera sp. TA3 TaxID=3435775 RepID=UPI003EBA25FB